MSRFIFIIFFLSTSAYAKSILTIKNVREIKYIREEIEPRMRSTEEIKTAQLRTHDLIEKIVKDLNELKVNFPNVRFYHIKNRKIHYVCQEVIEPFPKGLPAERIFVRPAGAYLSLYIEGNDEEEGFAKIRPFLKERNLQILSWEAYLYKTSAIPETREREYLFPIGPLEK